MEREVLFTVTAYIPPQFNDSQLRQACFTCNSSYESIEVPRVYKFYSDDEKSLRMLITKLELIIIN